MADVGTYLRTLRHLRGEQLLARVRRIVVHPAPDDSPRPSVRDRRSAIADPIPRSPEWLSPERVEILNVARDLAGRRDWAPADVSRLWLYHLHYFSDLPGRACSEDAEWLRDVVASWVERNPPGTKDAWDPYPTSLRISNWVKWLLRAGGCGPERNEGPALQSLAVQTRYLTRSLERDVSANHLFANAVALSLSGLFFGGDEGDRWLSAGLKLLSRELGEQVLADGGHYERAPMYHALVLEQILDVLNVSDGAVCEAVRVAPETRERLQSAAARMLDWLEAMTHPDGDLAFFNDSTLGVAPTLRDLAAYAGRVGLRGGAATFDGAGDAATADSDRDAAPLVIELRESGYYRLTSVDGSTVVLFDAGPIGPNHQPGHGHCDALSFEVSHGGRRLLVNSGVSTYDPGPERLRQRRTAAHNAVRVDGEEQCELWSSHRCGRRHGILSAGAARGSVEGSHSGFAHLPGSPLHHRTISLAGRRLTIRDGFDGTGEHAIEWFLRVHPDLDVEPVAGGFALGHEGTALAKLRIPAEMSPSLTESTWHPGFNVSIPCRLVAASWRGRLPSDFTLDIELH